MTRSLRALVRLARASWFLASWTLRLRTRRPVSGEAAQEQWRREYFGGAARGLLQRLGVEVETEGSFPAGAGFLVTNHLGYLDVLVLASLGPAVFVSRSDVASWPLIGRLTRWCATIFIDRSRRDQLPSVLEEMAGALGRGAQVVFFPEGTSGAGDRVMPFRGSLFEVALRSGAPVRVAALSYATEPGDPPARHSVCWWGDAGFARHLAGLAGLRRVRARVRFAAEPVAALDRKQLAQACHAAICARFEAVTGSEAAP